MSYNCQWDRTPKARKNHVCQVCGCTIPKGTVYHKQSGIFNGAPYTWVVHEDCAQVYWSLNKDAWDSDYMEVSDFDWQDIHGLRGFYPHAVCRLELKVFTTPTEGD